ncbi:MAG TPA: monovalent cation/H+ antiporter complex subunit F [Arachnia sp.]|nr:monovalent cation/H+ antiporter complex subunit F [Arachnia sp.]
MILTITSWIVIVALALSVLAGLWRAFTARDSATRAIVGDMVFFGCVGILVVQGMLQGSVVSVDLSLIAAILGIVATLALARILTRGRR